MDQNVIHGKINTSIAHLGIDKQHFCMCGLKKPARSSEVVLFPGPPSVK